MSRIRIVGALTSASASAACCAIPPELMRIWRTRRGRRAAGHHRPLRGGGAAAFSRGQRVVPLNARVPTGRVPVPAEREHRLVHLLVVEHLRTTAGESL